MARRADAEAIAESEASGETIAVSTESYLGDVQALAAEYIDATEEFAKRLLDLQSRATSWAKDTPLAAVFEALNSLGQQLVEVSARIARAVWQVSRVE